MEVVVVYRSVPLILPSPELANLFPTRWESGVHKRVDFVNRTLVFA